MFQLSNCVCDGNEGFDCDTIKKNMNLLCFNTSTTESSTVEVNENETTEDTEDTKHPGIENSAGKAFNIHLVISILFTYLNSYIGHSISDTVTILYQNI